MSQNAGQITLKRGQFSSSSCTTQNDLIANQALKPAIRKMLEFKNKRYLMTLLTSDALQKGGSEYFINNNQKTRIPLVENAKGIGNFAYRFDVIGRIEKPAVILNQVGSSGTDGSFSLRMQDNHLVPGMTAIFNGGRYQARVMAYPTGSAASGFIYNFRSPNGTVFVYATHVAGQTGTKTCMGAYTSYSEGSYRGYSRDKHPDTFIQHMTIQRKSCEITGSAASDVLWYEYSNASGAESWWMYWKLNQAMATMAIENERHKWFGVSSMKNTDGSLATQSLLGNDPETGLPIITGDGFEEQVAGDNIVYGSGTNGEATEDDFSDLMTKLQKNSNMLDGIIWVAVTGTDGYANAQEKMINLAGNQNINLVQLVSQTSDAGGARPDVGYNYASFNVNGNKVVFIKHPMFDDNLMFTEEISGTGRSAMSSTYFFMGLNGDASGSQRTMEILAKEANGVNRSDVQATLQGMTGKPGTIVTQEDKMVYATLKEDLFAIYNTSLCGIIYPTV